MTDRPGTRTGDGRTRRAALTDARLILMEAVVVGLTVLALVGIVPRWLALIVALADAVLGAVLVVPLLRQRERLRRLADAASATPGVAVSGASVPPPLVAPLVEDLERLGFHLLGALDTTLPGRDAFRSWVLADASGETWAEVGGTSRALCVLLSQTAGGRIVEVGWPRGSDIDEPALLAARGSATVELTLADHRARLAAERQRESDLGIGVADRTWPDGRRVRSFDDYLAWEPVQRARTGGMRLRNLVRTRVDPAIRWAEASVLVSGSCCVVLVVAWALAASGA